MLAYKLKVIYVEGDKPGLLPIKQNKNVYPRVLNNYGDSSRSDIPDGRCLCGTLVPNNLVLRSN